VFLGQPLRVTQLGGAARVGEAPAQAFHLAGYSAPELVHQAVVTGKEDVYTLGAILYRAATGQPLPESGVELSELPASVPVPGLPQLLAGALGPAEERLDLERFYRQLLDFKQRLAKTAIALELASGTTVGLNPTRPVNEDSCGYVSWSVGDAAGASFRALLCVADGMGGMEAGELASQTALQTVLRAAVGALPPTTVDEAPNRPVETSSGLDPVALVRQSASAVYAALGGKQSGTTMTCLAIQDGVLTLGHVGDTRAYLLREGVLTQLTADNSLVAAMVASGVLTKDEARGHPDSNKVLRSLGGHRELPERYVDSLAAAYDQPSLQLQPGDRLLVCSDGVWGSVDDEQLRTILREAIDCRIAVEVGPRDHASR
jgi:serine/threonine protein phosphatase PrpC